MIRFQDSYVVRVLTVVATLGAAACGATSPSSPGASANGSGATITGVVNTGSNTSLRSVSPARSLLATTSAVTVTVNGTNISTGVDGTGHFRLTNVPDGTVQLHFSGSGMDAMITLTDVHAGDTIDIDVSVDGHDAHIDRDERHHDGEDHDELEGTIAAVNTSARTITIGTTVVTVPSTALIHRDSTTLTLVDLRIGQRVEVHTTGSGSALTATEINVEDD